MNQFMFLIVICLPVLGGLGSFLLPFKDRKWRCVYVQIITTLTSVLVGMLLWNAPEGIFPAIKFTGDLTVSFRVDGLSRVFSGLVAALWPFATLYSFEYMKHEENENRFYFFYLATYGVTLGIAFASDLFTLYFCYELLTLVTMPLVLHTMKREAILATRKYLYYSLGGAAFAFVGLIFIINFGQANLDFTLGGILDATKIGPWRNRLLLIYVMAFLGFGVKAAIFPFHGWLPTAGVAPTPVTALLHAVAVVKAGAFAIIRLTYYCFGTDFLQGTWAQHVVMAITMFTIVFGCSKAVKETHLKRRLAYSTVSNLSYILFGVTLMTPLGLLGALAHMVFHGVMKICAFFCMGSVMHQTGSNYVNEIDGYGKKMPWVFGIFTIAALSLMGVPGLPGFISKWYLAQAAVATLDVQAYLGIGCLLISALLTAIYTMTMIVRAFFVEPKNPLPAKVKDPGLCMLIPLGSFAAFMIIFGIYSKPIIDFLTNVAYGIY